MSFDYRAIRRSRVGKRTSARRKKRKANLRQCDAVFSKLVRSVGRCEAWDYEPPEPSLVSAVFPLDMPEFQKVECRGSLQCAHIISRRYRGTRWLRENALCLCAAHHTYWTFRPLEFERFLLDTIGPDALDALKRKALAVTHVDYEAVLAELSQ